MRPSSRLLSLAGLAFGALLTVAACSSAASTPGQSVLGATSGTAGVTLGEGSSVALGSFLTGNNGMTLYVFTKDSPGTSACSGQCAAYWPPLTVASGASVTGPADATAGFGTITRADGTTQVTYNHMPLYYFASDKKAGDTNGQDVQGSWFVAPVSGVLATAAAPSSSAMSSTGANTGSGLTLGSTDTALGTFLTGPNGMTLYVFTKDSADKSTCSGQCAAYWPPLTVTSGATVTGPADATLGFGMITRADGTMQVTYNHTPLYYFASDKKAGDTTGQGVQGSWFVASVNGSTKPAATPAAASYGY